MIFTPKIIGSRVIFVNVANRYFLLKLEAIVIPFGKTCSPGRPKRAQNGKTLERNNENNIAEGFKEIEKRAS